jgi:hypothetical protein
MKSSGVLWSALGAAIAISLALLISGVRISPVLLFSLGGTTVFLFAANPLIMVHHHAGLSSLGMPVGAGVLTSLLVAFLWSGVRPGKKYPGHWR